MWYVTSGLHDKDTEERDAPEEGKQNHRELTTSKERYKEGCWVAQEYKEFGSV